MSLLLLALLGLFNPAIPVQDQATDQYHYIVGLYDKGLYDLTIKEAEKFLQKYPGHKQASLARYRLASALFELDKKSEAAPHYRALTSKPGFKFEAEASFRLAQCDLAAGKNDLAAKSLTKVLEIGETYLKEPATFLLGEAHFRQDKFKEAETQYVAVLKLAPKGGFVRDASYGLAWCSFRLGDYDKAVQHIQGFLTKFPKDDSVSELRFLLGESHLEAGRHKEALTAYKGVEEGPFKDAALRGSGFSYAALGDSKAAAAEFGKLIEEYPTSRFAEEAALHQGIQFLNAGDSKSALPPLKMATTLAMESKENGRITEALYWRAQAESKAGGHEQALKSLDQALALKPSGEIVERINIARGDVLFALGRSGEATAAYGQSGSAYAVHAAAVASLNAGQNEEAIRMARTVIQKFADSKYVAQAQLTLGEALLRMDKHAEAQAAFQAAMKTEDDPARLSRALSRIGWCQFLLGDHKASAKSFARVGKEFAKATEVEESLFMEGRSHEAAGNGAGAATAWTSYLTRYPKGEHRAETLMGLARLDDGAAGVGHLASLVKEYEDDPLVPQALYEMSERLSSNGKFAEAAKGYGEMLERFPKHELVAPAQYGLAWCQFELKQYKETAATLEPIAAGGTKDPDLAVAALELQVWAFEKARNAEGAAQAFNKLNQVCQDKQRCFRAASTVTLALRDAKKLDEAQAMLGNLVKTVKDDELAASILVERSYLGLDRGDLAQAEAMVRDGLQRSPKNTALAEAAFFVGEAAFEAEEYDKAVDLYKISASVKDCPVADKALYKQGFAHMRLEDMKGASTSFQALVAGHPASDLFGESLFLLGEALFRLEDYKGAADALKRLRQEVPRHTIMPKALYRLGIAQCHLREWQDAEGALSELAQRNPDFENAIEADLWRGRALAALKNDRAARQAFDRVVSSDRGVLAARARLGIGKIHYDGDNLEEALSEFLKVAVLYAHPDEVSEGLYYAGQCLEKLGDTDRAKVQYREILEKYPESSYAEVAQKRLGEMGSA